MVISTRFIASSPCYTAKVINIRALARPSERVIDIRRDTLQITLAIYLILSFLLTPARTETAIHFIL